MHRTPKIFSLVPIGDVADSSYDLQVFLRAQSFVPEPASAGLLMAGAFGVLARRTRRR